MKEEDRQYYIDWLLIYYPFKAASYFEKMSNRELLIEYEKTLDLT